MKTVFIDGQVGTTGLQIHERLANRDDIEIVSIEDEYRKDLSRKKEIINSVDIAILCLPDEPAKEAAALVENSTTRIIDASTAHRTNPQWVYGLAELSTNQREAIARAQFVANPGCHATGFIAPIAPLVAQGVTPTDYPFSVTSLTGYSGGGKKLIARYEDAPAAERASLAARPYGFSMMHKHRPEMKVVTGIDFAPTFLPVVADFSQGMLVTTMLENRLLSKNVTAQDIHGVLSEHYADSFFVSVKEFGGEEYLDGGFLDATTCNNTNNLEIFVFGHDEQTMIVSRFDNLGKGASGAAIQNMNIMLGLDETIGLV